MQKSRNVHQPSSPPDPCPAATPERSSAPPALWTKPELVAYGDVRQLTMGGSPGFGDSGGSGGTQFP